MANQNTAALHARAAELATKAAELIKLETPLLVIVNNPQCGKPGRGFKAARRARAALRAIEPRKAQVEAQYNEYLTAGKASHKTREQRAAAFQAVLATLI